MQGWLIPPPKIEPGRRYPMIVVIHGGPSGVVTSSWPDNFSLTHRLAAEGYFVFVPNPRGSYGQGEAFTRANVKDFGGGDLRDILSGVDRVVARSPGGSGAPRRDWLELRRVHDHVGGHADESLQSGDGRSRHRQLASYYGENLIDQWMIPFFGASVYDDPAVYAKSSPITFIKHVKTPTLVIVGERDAECPAPQSFEFWHALKTLGVPTELVVYPGEGHMFTDSTHSRDVEARTVAWFAKYLGNR